MIATAVDVDALWQTVVAATVAGVGVTATFSLTILGATRFAECSREGRALEAGAYAALAIVGLLASAAAIVAAFIVMTD